MIPKMHLLTHTVRHLDHCHDITCPINGYGFASKFKSYEAMGKINVAMQFFLLMHLFTFTEKCNSVKSPGITSHAVEPIITMNQQHPKIISFSVIIGCDII